MTKTFPPIEAAWTRSGRYNDAESAASFAVKASVATGESHVVTSEMGSLCPTCATSWLDSDPMTLTVEPGHHCYNCDDN